MSFFSARSHREIGSERQLILLLLAACSFQTPDGGFLSHGGTPPNHPKLDHFSIETHVFLEILHFEKPPHVTYGYVSKPW